MRFVPISAFAKMIIKTILYRNQYHVLDTYDRDADSPKTYPQSHYIYGTGKFKTVQAIFVLYIEKILPIMILPRMKVSISTSGVNLWGLYYIWGIRFTQRRLVTS